MEESACKFNTQPRFKLYVRMEHFIVHKTPHFTCRKQTEQHVGVKIRPNDTVQRFYSSFISTGDRSFTIVAWESIKQFKTCFHLILRCNQSKLLFKCVK